MKEEIFKISGIQDVSFISSTLNVNTYIELEMILSRKFLIICSEVRN